MLLTREAIIEAIHSALINLKGVDALWVSGSAGFNRIDEYSDIDLRVLAHPSVFAKIFQCVEEALNSIGGIEDTYTPLNSTYPQCFYRLKNASPFHIVDFVCVPEEVVDKFLDRQRMGQPIVLFDRAGKIQALETPEATYQEFSLRQKDLLNQFRVLSRVLVERAIARGRFAEALHFYNTRVIAPLMEILRHKYCPARQDFGLRYLQWDLPKEIVATLDQLHQVSSFEDLKRCLDRAETLFWTETHSS